MIEDGKVLYARHGDVWVLCFDGAIRYTMAYSLDRFVDWLFERESPQAIYVDLSRATSIDSTGIGLLAKIARGLRTRGAFRPLLFSSNPEINEFLTSVCLDRIYTLVAAVPQLEHAQRLPQSSPTEEELAHTIVDAHRLLCDLSENNRARFSSVIEAFEHELS
jgi:anti-anti-sigma factor